MPYVVEAKVGHLIKSVSNKDMHIRKCQMDKRSFVGGKHAWGGVGRIGEAGVHPEPGSAQVRGTVGRGPNIIRGMGEVGQANKVLGPVAAPVRDENGTYEGIRGHAL